MTTKAERYQKLYGRRKDELLSTLLPVAGAFDDAQTSGQLTAERITIISNALCHPRLLVAMNASELFWAMSKRWPEQISQAVTEVYQNPKAHARFAAICSLTKQTPQEVLTKLLKSGLKDKSGRVRGKVLERVEHFERKDLIPDILEMINAEKNAKTRQHFEYHLKMLRDGYVVNERKGRPAYVWVRTARGCTGRQISTAAIAAKGIEAAAVELMNAVLAEES